MGVRAEGHPTSRSAVGLALVGLVLLGASCGLTAPDGPTGLRAEQGAETSPAPDATIARGEELYAPHCQPCHGNRNGDGGIATAPRHNQDGHTWHHTDLVLLDTITNGSGERGVMLRRMTGVPDDAPRMPAWQGALSEDDMQAVLALIKTWWTPEQRRMQGKAPKPR